jgi:hypothetical protein
VSAAIRSANGAVKGRRSSTSGHGDVRASIHSKHNKHEIWALTMPMKRYTFSQLDCHVTSEAMGLLKAECAKTGKYDCLILIECLEKSTRLPEDGVDQILPELDGDWLKDGDFSFRRPS